MTKLVKPLILVTNDDGITSPGIRMLIKQMNILGDVVVVAKGSVDLLQHLKALLGHLQQSQFNSPTRNPASEHAN